MSERGFEGLDFYRDSLKLLKAAYRLAGSLPDYERYNLTDQLRRAAVSIGLNIAEGYGRYHFLDRLRFLYIARGSLNETLSCFIIAEQLEYCDAAQMEWTRQLVSSIEKNLNGYCRSIRQLQQGGDEFGVRYTAEEHTLYIVPSAEMAE
jgi:four helix bundle protein